MLELAVIAAALILLRRQLGQLESGAATAMAPKRISARVQQMTEYADRLYAQKKWVAAEKAYLQVLKVDHKNVTAYSHLGIIYSTQKNMSDAIECFQIAARIHPSAVTFQNLGLAYFDNKNYIKSIAAYEKAIMFEPSVHRYIGLSKAQSKLSNTASAVSSLEKAAALEPSVKVLKLLADAYRLDGRKAQAAETEASLRDLPGRTADVAGPS